MHQPAQQVPSHSIQDILKTVFGYEAFRGQQEAIIQHVVAGDDALVIMPTGGGKSLCYQIPAMAREGCGIVISPLIALMQDQVSALHELGIEAGFLNSTQSQEENARVEEALRVGQLDLLYIAPERLKQPRTLNILRNTQISLLAIDEAHCVSQWGHDFRSDYLQLGVLAEHFPGVPRIALTATADERTRQEISQRLQLSQAKHFLAGFDRPNIRYRITLKQQAKQQLLHFLRTEHADHAGIVYCLSRKKVEGIAEWLEEQGFNAVPYHAGLSHDVRERNQARFLREDNIIVVATIAFGMGIDKPDVRFVAHLDLPKSIEAYYQETGRAGRDGQAANAWMVYGLEDVIKLREMMQQSNTVDNVEYKRVEAQKLDAMLGLCEVTSCRRQVLLQYFGDELEEPCGNCDICLQPVETWDASEAAQKAISCAYRTEQRFGVNHLIDVLMGAQTEKIKQFSHNQLSVYGIGRSLGKVQWRSVYRQLIAKHYLQVDFENYNSIKLHENCRALLKGEDSLYLRKDPVDKNSSKRKSYQSSEKQQGKLWDALRACRMQIAKTHNVPPYVIFHDSTLMDMAASQPTNRQQFAQLSGVGESKLENYADAFIQVIIDYRRNQSESLSSTIIETYEIFQQGLLPEAIAEKRELSLATIYTHLSLLIKEGRLLLSQVIDLPADELERVQNTLLDYGLTDAGGKLKPVYEALGEVYSYSVIRCVYMHSLRAFA